MILYVRLTDNEEQDISILKDLSLKKRDTNILDIFFIDELGRPVDITGATVFLTIKPTATTVDASATLSKTITDLTDAPAGECEITITPADLAGVAVGNFLYDIQIKESDGTIHTVAEGNLCVKTDLTIRTE